ncbi:MAG: dihydroxyacetone kinase subunit DhaK [Planctomycetaceae bacterium]|jgi:dihydroxyacetone kinase-like protein|nr:dihydroxyacetone kinase subunit DhaK [Planctomycetaceae bacterium]
MVMKKFLNNPEQITVELLEGFVLAYSKTVRLVSEKIVVRATPKPKNKVAIITMGGSGHEPALSGYVGEGILDASVVGDIFAAPGGPKVLEALRLFKDHPGILLVILNHAGDVMNGNLAYNLAVKEGINVKKILTAEDIAPGIDAPVEDRRGLGGCVPLFKVAGAAAEEGKNLDEVFTVAEKFNQTMATLAVTMKTATHPQSGQYISELPDDMMEIGMGQHGEGGGTGPQKILTADATAEIMVRKLIAAIKLKKGDKATLIINGSGATTLMEQFLVFRKAHHILTEQGIEVIGGRCEEILTVQEAAGFQMFLAKLDEETQHYFEAPSNTPYWVTR